MPRPFRLAVTPGEFQVPDGSQWFARLEYLATLRHLRDDPTAGSIASMWRGLGRIADEPDAPRRADAIGAWAGKYGCADAWLLDVVPATIEVWREDPAFRVEQEWHGLPRLDMWTGPPVPLAPWDVQRETEAAFLAHGRRRPATTPSWTRRCARRCGATSRTSGCLRHSKSSAR